ncbi:MAG: hypothetical protein HQM02_06280, partial [Magnetococcales bacterium]|nr:hypothetical protein [Magnetococcales bacterium]
MNDPLPPRFNPLLRFVRDHAPALLVLALGIGVYHWVYAGFFSAESVGHDFSFILPMLLENDYWIRNNGILATNWFLPGLCGGQPGFPDLQNMFFSIPQWLTLFLPPIQAVYATVLLFAVAGYWGMYLFLARILRMPGGMAVAGAILFMFNGFFAARMMVGHFTFHAFMLLPLLAHLLVRPLPAERHWSREVPWAVALGLGGAYLIHAGMINLLLPALLILFGLVGLALTVDPLPARTCLVRWPLAALLTISLSASKVLAGVALLDTFPRSDYSLPGFTSPWHTLLALGRSLFWQPEELQTNYFSHMAYLQWGLDVHEWMFGISPLPLALLLAWLILRWSLG